MGECQPPPCRNPATFAKPRRLHDFVYHAGMSEEPAAPDLSGGSAEGDWSPASVQRLRARLGLSQAELAERVGTRQQTISEWETGTRTPRRMSRRLLRMVAEASGIYDVREPDA